MAYDVICYADMTDFKIAALLYGTKKGLVIGWTSHIYAPTSGIFQDIAMYGDVLAAPIELHEMTSERLDPVIHNDPITTIRHIDPASTGQWSAIDIICEKIKMVDSGKLNTIMIIPRSNISD